MGGATSFSSCFVNNQMNLRAIQLHEALRLILRNEPFAGSFARFLEKFKPEKLIFAEYFGELERLMMIFAKAPVITPVPELEDEGLNMRNAILSHSSILTALFNSHESIHSKMIDFQCEGMLLQSLLPLFHHRTSFPDQQSLHQHCKAMLMSCQTSLLYHMIGELAWFVRSEEFFLRFQTSPVPTHQMVARQILLNVQPPRMYKPSTIMHHDYYRDENDCDVTDSLSDLSP